jgi:uncharacterized protein
LSQQPRNLLVAFRRDKKRDFASGTGAELLASKVRQVLLTEGATPHSTGELPWRSSFGAGLSRLRHQRNDTVLAALARVYIRDALAHWLPGVQFVQVRVEQDAAVLTLRVRVGEGDTTADFDVSIPG